MSFNIYVYGLYLYVYLFIYIFNYWCARKKKKLTCKIQMKRGPKSK